MPPPFGSSRKVQVVAEKAQQVTDLAAEGAPSGPIIIIIIIITVITTITITITFIASVIVVVIISARAGSLPPVRIASAWGTVHANMCVYR